MTGGFSKRTRRTGRAFSGASASAPCRAGVASTLGAAATLGAASVFAGSTGFFVASVLVASARFAVLFFALGSLAAVSFLAMAVVRSCAYAAPAQPRQKMMQRMMMVF